MKSVEFAHAKYATNESGEGLFKLTGSGYSQIRGNSQTPVFRTSLQFISYIRRLSLRPGRVIKISW